MLVQLIFLDTKPIWRGDYYERMTSFNPYNFVSRARAVGMFALGAQQIFYDGDTVYVTDAFKHDATHQTFTVTYCENENEATCIYNKFFTSLLSRYPAWRLHIPPQFAKYFYHLFEPTNVVFTR